MLYIHYEMLGYILEYIKHTPYITFNIYAKLIYSGIDWLNYYNDNFNMNISWYDPDNFNPENYDYIILLTDDDMTFKNDWLIKYYNKIITINHFHKNRRILTKYNIGTRFFVSNPEQKWTLPSYIGINKNDKLNTLTNKIIVSCIGIQNIPPSTLFLRDLFTNFDEIEFHIIARNISYNYDNNNIYTYTNPTPQFMFNIIKKSQYILCIDKPHNHNPKSNSISGAIPLSFSYGCNLIIPEIWQTYYNFKSCISYLDNHVQNNGQSKLTLSKNINLDNIYNELYELINNRNNVFNNILIDNLYSKNIYKI